MVAETAAVLPPPPQSLVGAGGPCTGADGAGLTDAPGTGEVAIACRKCMWWEGWCVRGHSKSCPIGCLGCLSRPPHHPPQLRSLRIGASRPHVHNPRATPSTYTGRAPPCSSRTRCPPLRKAVASQVAGAPSRRPGAAPGHWLGCSAAAPIRPKGRRLP